MKRFAFRYEVLLTVRERREGEERERYRQVKARLNEEIAEKERLAQDLIDRRQAFAQASGPGRLDLEALGFAQQFITGLERALDAQSREVALWDARAFNQQESLAAAAREAEAIRRLKAKHFEAWQRELESQEAKFLDELATLRFTRSRQG